LGCCEDAEHLLEGGNWVDACDQKERDGTPEAEKYR